MGLWVFRQKGFCLGFLYRCFALGKRVWSFEPFKLRALFRLLVLVLLGRPLGGGVHSHNDVLFDDKSRLTGVTGVFVFLVFVSLLLLFV